MASFLSEARPELSGRAEFKSRRFLLVLFFLKEKDEYFFSVMEGDFTFGGTHPGNNQKLRFSLCLAVYSSPQRDPGVCNSVCNPHRPPSGQIEKLPGANLLRNNYILVLIARFRLVRAW